MNGGGLRRHPAPSIGAPVSHALMPAVQAISPVGRYRQRGGEGGWPLTLAIALLPLLQIGYSYYGSFAALALLSAGIGLRRRLLRGFERGWLFVLLVPVMLLAAVNATGIDLAGDMLRIMREAVFLLVMLFMSLGGEGPAGSLRTMRRIEGVLLALSAAALMLVVIQAHYIAQLVFVTFPHGWFVQNGDTLAGDLDLLYSLIRPSATYGEPSYLGFVLLSVIVMVSPRLLASRRAQAIVAFCLATGLMARSLSFVVAAVAILAMLLIQPARTGGERERRQLLLGMILAVVVMAAILGGVGERFDAVGGHIDSSAEQRLFDPIRILPRFLFAHPFGLPLSQLPAVLVPLAGSGLAPIDNALANLFFEYGLVTGGVILAALLLTAPTRLIAVYAVFAMSFNGAFLSVDKAAVWLMTLAIYGLARGVAVDDKRPASRSLAAAAPTPA